MSVSLRGWLGGCVLLGAGGALVACAAGDTARSDGASPGANSSIAPYGGGATNTGSSASNGGSSSNTAPGGTSTNSEATPAPTQVGSSQNNGAQSNGELGGSNQSATGTSSGSGDQLGSAQMGGSGQSSDRYQKADVQRDGQNYYFMANGWGPGFQSQSVTWSGTSFTVASMQGTQGPNYEPASYPTVFCGQYSDSKSKACGLPATLDSMKALRTGWSWSPNGNDTQQYDAAYDIWLGTGSDISTHSGFLMVWYRDPPGQQPAGKRTMQGLTVSNVSGSWDIWTGAVGGLPIINYVRPEGQDTHSMEFDILDFVRDAKTRGLTIPGTTVLSVAVGFEIWKGPVTNLQSSDFYIDVQN
jgi:hypothetical protein